MTYDACIGAARRSLDAGRWAEARDAFNAALGYRETAEALDGMGAALWWLGDVRASLRRRERGYALYCADGRLHEAAVIALDISVCYLGNLDNVAAARGWMARARTAAATSGDSGMTGWLWSIDGYTNADPDEQQVLLGKALDFARSSGDVDLELVAMADLGLTMVTRGDVAAGLEFLDEAMAGDARRRVPTAGDRRLDQLQHAGRVQPGARPEAGRAVVRGRGRVHRALRPTGRRRCSGPSELRPRPGRGSWDRCLAASVRCWRWSSTG